MLSTIQGGSTGSTWVWSRPNNEVGPRLTICSQLKFNHSLISNDRNGLLLPSPGAAARGNSGNGDVQPRYILVNAIVQWHLRSPCEVSVCLMTSLSFGKCLHFYTTLHQQQGNVLRYLTDHQDSSHCLQSSLKLKPSARLPKCSLRW